MKESFKISVHPKHYSSKPTDAYNLQKGYATTNTTLNGLKEVIYNGQTIVPAILKDGYRKNSNFSGSQVIFLDFDDNQNPQTEIEKLSDYGINVNLLYNSYSHTSEYNKFRLVIVLDKVIEDALTFKNVMTSLIRVGGSDEACKDVSRMFYAGTNPEIINEGLNKLEDIKLPEVKIKDKKKGKKKVKKSYTDTPLYITFEQREFNFDAACNNSTLFNQFDKGEVHLKYLQLRALISNLMFVKGGLEYVQQKMNDRGDYKDEDYSLLNKIPSAGYQHPEAMESFDSSIVEDYHNVLALDNVFPDKNIEKFFDSVTVKEGTPRIPTYTAPIESEDSLNYQCGIRDVYNKEDDEWTKTGSNRPNFWSQNLRSYWDENTEDTTWFEGVNFLVQEDAFDSMSANKDINNDEGFGEDASAPTEENFLERLRHNYHAGRFINSDCNAYDKYYELIVRKLHEGARADFNVEYVINEFIPQWSNEEVEADEFMNKPRTWKLYNTEGLNDDNFRTLQTDDIRRYKNNRDLLLLREAMMNEDFIDKDDFNLEKRRDNEIVWDLINSFNENIIGISTRNQYEANKNISKYLNNIGGVQNCGWCNNIYYSNPKNVTPSKKSLIRQGFSKRYVRAYIDFKPTLSVLEDINTEISYLINNPHDIKINRVRTESSSHIEVSPLYTLNEIKELERADRELERQGMEYKITKDLSLAEAFDYELDTKGGAFRITRGEAVTMGQEFYYKWCVVNDELDELEASQLWRDIDDEMESIRTK